MAGSQFSSGDDQRTPRRSRETTPLLGKMPGDWPSSPSAQDTPLSPSAQDTRPRDRETALIPLQMPGAWPSSEPNAERICSPPLLASSHVPGSSTFFTDAFSTSTKSEGRGNSTSTAVVRSQHDSSKASKMSQPSEEPDGAVVKNNRKRKGKNNHAVAEDGDPEAQRKRIRKTKHHTSCDLVNPVEKEAISSMLPQDPLKKEEELPVPTKSTPVKSEIPSLCPMSYEGDLIILLEKEGISSMSPQGPLEEDELPVPTKSTPVKSEVPSLCRMPYEVKAQICTAMREISPDTFHQDLMNLVYAVCQQKDKAPQMQFEEVLCERLCTHITYGLPPKGLYSFKSLTARAPLIKHLHINNCHQFALSELFTWLLESMQAHQLLSLVYWGSLNLYTLAAYLECIKSQHNLQLLVIPTFSDLEDNIDLPDLYLERTTDHLKCLARRITLDTEVGTKFHHKLPWSSEVCLQDVRMYVQIDIPGRKRAQHIFVDRNAPLKALATSISGRRDDSQINALTIMSERLNLYRDIDLESKISLLKLDRPLDVTTLRLSGMSMDSYARNLKAHMGASKLRHLNLHFCGQTKLFLENLGAQYSNARKLESLILSLPRLPDAIYSMRSTMPHLYAFFQSLPSHLKYVHLDVDCLGMESDMEEAWNAWDDRDRYNPDIDPVSGAVIPGDPGSGADHRDQDYPEGGPPRRLGTMPIREQSFYRHWDVPALFRGHEKTIETLSLMSLGRRPSPEDMYALGRFSKLRGLGIPFPFVLNFIGHIHHKEYKLRVKRLASELRNLTNLKYLYLHSPRVILNDVIYNEVLSQKQLRDLARCTFDILRSCGVLIDYLSIVIRDGVTDTRDYQMNVGVSDNEVDRFWHEFGLSPPGEFHLHAYDSAVPDPPYSETLYADISKEELPFSLKLFGSGSVFHYDKVLNETKDCYCHVTRDAVKIAD